MAVSSIPSEITSESKTSMVLNSLMYVNKFPASADGKTVHELLQEQASLYAQPMFLGLDAEEKAYFESVCEYVYGEKPLFDEYGKLMNCTTPKDKIGNMVYMNHSSNARGEKDGAIGATFYSLDSSGKIEDVYVSYRGTGDGRWYDNGDAFSKEYSEYQQDAAEYFDSVMKELVNNHGVSEQTNVYTTGHSKGGNQAQFVTLASEYAYLVDKCISMDGEGFSPEAIEYFKELYGEDFYNGQIEKLYAVCGDNDYVNVLGIKVIPEDHTVYVKSPTDTYDLPNGHGLINVDTGTGNLFDFSKGKFYETTDQQRDLAVLAKSLSENIMYLPKEERQEVCRSLMSLLEKMFTGGVGLNGEVATPEEYLGLIQYADEILSEFLYTWDGNQFIKSSISDALKKYVFQIENGEKAPVIVDLICNISAYGIRWGLEPLLHQINYFVDIVSTCADIAEVLMPVIEFCSNVAKVAWKILRLTYDANYREAQAYLANATLIQLHTQDLHDLASKLWAINGRLETLDSRLDSLYSKVRWRDLWSLMNADFKVCWSSRINKCANCLNDTANRFEGVEQQLLQMLE